MTPTSSHKHQQRSPWDLGSWDYQDLCPWRNKNSDFSVKWYITEYDVLVNKHGCLVKEMYTVQDPSDQTVPSEFLRKFGIQTFISLTITGYFNNCFFIHKNPSRFKVFKTLILILHVLTNSHMLGVYFRTVSAFILNIVLA
jgi:hypothetical protein